MLLTIREMQIKTIVRHHLTSIRVVKEEERGKRRKGRRTEGKRGEEGKKRRGR